MKKDTKKKNTKKQKRTINIVIYTIAALLIVFAIVLLVREFVFIPPEPYTTPPPQDALHTLEPVDRLGTPVDPDAYEIIPVKFHFIKQEVSTNIMPVGIDENNVMESVDSASMLSWLSVSPYVAPGDVGNAVIAGHNLWRGEAGVFSLLKKMSIGDSVAITFDNGSVRYFKVAEIYECSYSDLGPMSTDASEPILTLITCKGDWSSTLGMSKTRVVVICKPIHQ